MWAGGSCKANPCQFDNVEPLADGAAYDPAADAWRKIATSPLAARTGTASAWTGKEVLVWGGTSAPPRVRRRRRLQPCDRHVAHAAAVAPLVRAGPRACGPARSSSCGAAATSSTPSTSPTAPPMTRPPTAGGRSPPIPLPARDRVDMAWTGKEVVVWGGGTSNEAFGDGAAYDPAADRWRPMAKSPLAPPVRRGQLDRQGARDLGRRGLGPGLRRRRGVRPGHRHVAAAARGAHQRPDRHGPGVDGQGGADLGRHAGAPTTTSSPTAPPTTPPTDRWRRIPTWTGRLVGADVWTGKEMVVWGGTSRPAAPAAPSRSRAPTTGSGTRPSTGLAWRVYVAVAGFRWDSCEHDSCGGHGGSP